MKPSRALSINPWTNLHPPLPRTPRQSQQLLNALTSSFRRELDREHPPVQSASEQSSSGKNALSGNRPTEERPHSSSHATDKHLRMILDNPLFRLTPSHAARSVSHGQPPNIDKARSQKEPMVVFDELVASGSATVGTVADCLSWQVLLASRHTGERFRTELRDSQAGSRTVSWWFSLNWRERTIFFNNGRVLPPLCKFMVAEGLHESIFVWLGLLKDRAVHGESNQMAGPLKYLLGTFVKAEYECGGGLSSAIRYYLDACRMLISTDNEESKRVLKGALAQSGGFLFSLIVTNPRENTKTAIPAELYENYATVLSAIIPGTGIVGASMPIYHPTRPDAKPFVQFLRSITPEQFESWSEKRRERFMRTGFKALHVLIDAGDLKDCEYLARFLQRHVEEERETEMSTSWRVSHVSSEEKALLNSLDLALA